MWWPRSLFLLLVACHGADKPVADAPEAEPTLGVSPRLYRLTHAQWERTTQDLLHLDAPSGLSAGFIGDTLHDGFDNNGDALAVSSELFRDYQVAAETLAVQVVRDPALYAEVVPQDVREAAEPVEERVEVDADPGISAENGAPVGTAWMLWSEGALYVDMPVEAAGTYTVSASLWSSDCGDGVYAEAEASVDGTAVGAWTTTAEETTYAGAVRLDAGAHTMKIAFTNDCYEEATGADRNLLVEWVGWEGPSDGVGASSAGEAEARAWLGDIGARAFRRPLTGEEVDTWYAVFARGPELVGSGDDFADGVQLVLTALLQSPAFLYRIEASTEADATGHIPLDSYELASKLSFSLWGTMPDDALFEVAAAGGLATPEQVRDVAASMLADERAHASVADFHAQLLQLDQTANVVKDEDDFPMYTSATPGFLREEAERFVDRVVWEDRGGLLDLLGADYTVANRSIAALYGVPGPADDDTWERVPLDPSQRSGLLTQAWFLAVHADSTTPSIIHRGVFVNRQILCVDIPDPPPNVPPLPPSEAGETNRERVEAHTGEGTCGASCHATVINPPGYALEAYDALGMYRTEDNGLPVDAASSYTFSTGTESWTDGVSFARLIAAHPDTHACYATHWLEYLLARAVSTDDAALVAPLGAASAAGDSVQDLMIELVASDAFRYRADEEAE